MKKEENENANRDLGHGMTLLWAAQNQPAVGQL